MKSGIYCIVNLINGKKYIGSAINIKKRWIDHKLRLNKNIHHSIHLQNAWNKYSEDNFKFEVLEFVQNKEELIKIEQYYLDWMETYKMENGYNINPKAGNNLGRHWSKETCEKLRYAMLGRQVSKETRAKHSLHSLGRKHSEESKRKMSEYRKGKKLSEETKKKISLSLKETFSKPEMKEKLRNRKRPLINGMLGKHHSKEAKQKMSEARKGEKNSNFGKHHSEETKEKIRQANSILTWEQVKEIRKIWEIGEMSQGKLSKMFNVSKGCIQGIVDEVNWNINKEE